MSAPWLEEWHCESRGMGLVFGVYGIYGQPVPMRLDTREGAPRARLAAAAPALVRALLAVEWACLETDEGSIAACAECGSPGAESAPRHVVDGQERYWRHVPHRDGCIVDAALTQVGLPDQASRDEAREAIAERGRA